MPRVLTPRTRFVGMGALIAMLVCGIFPVGYAFNIFGFELRFPAWYLNNQEVHWAPDNKLKISYISAYFMFAYFTLAMESPRAVTYSSYQLVSKNL